MRRLTFFGFILLCATSVSAAPPLTYEADVRPILKAHCFLCHGEAGEREGSLDLRLKRFMVTGGDSGPAIVPGKPDESVLIERIEAGEMPPENKHPVEPDDLKTLKQWIAQGAHTARVEPETIGDDPIFTDEERNWWSFRPVKRPDVPSLPDASTIETPIDAFLLSRLQTETKTANEPSHFQFAERASREVLIRRAYFDLLGLPPTPDEVAEFVADDRPDAWNRLLDRLLASPHYGERWGRHWLDVAGYADSEGYTDEDRVRPFAYHYRDYVVRAYNSNKPFDQFLIEQLAGDELVSHESQMTAEKIEKLTATGFLRMAPDGSASGGIDQGLARNQVVADTLQIVGTSLLGMTVHCAQCHDHRYDPIPQVDYYRLRAIFEPALDWKHWKTPAGRQISLYSDAQREQRSQIEAKAKLVDAERKQKVDHYISRTLEQELLLLPKESRDQLRDAFQTASSKRTKEQKDLLSAHPSIANIREGSLYLYERRKSARIDDINTQRDQREAELLQQTRAIEVAKLPDEIQADIAAALEVPTEERTPAQTELLAKYPNVLVTSENLAKINPDAAAELSLYTEAAEEIRTTNIRKDLQKYRDDAAAIRAKIPREDFLRALTETPGTVPATFVFHRGDHEQPRERVQPSGLTVLPNNTPLPENDSQQPTSARRLNYARYLTSGQHPLVARVIVNRVWMHHFGRGLVNSPADFGFLGERPSHPQLLDWLAAEFVQSGWDLKRLHRLILSSYAYQQSPTGDPQLALADPENRLYGRRTIRRLESEAVRDAMLTVSGQLNAKQFGEPVPVMEDEVGQIVIGRENLDGERKPGAEVSLNGDERRRSVYVQVRRSRTLASLEIFDAPTMTPNCEQRSDSNVAPQSLWFMNSQFVIDSSKHFAARLQSESPDDLKTQVINGWRLTFGSVPNGDDVEQAVAFVTLQQETFRDGSDQDSDDQAALEALASYCQALFSSSKFLYVE
ncbi:PSD1 and planctomycete cytochrome C domain-containing protein [Thalassoroseus pseudoceratinae]|uniref:PSD1 and planctomycete cytochrome C domain-containing protein n=1 Tax=Thalassoroseus pseudoceratinae TaxID=2713176 RepID=UPI0014239358|nr:PSD1 and planctomycete cytochrome C domain-containing protein [Thalassoroseus pseudoceratinae]